MTIGWSPGVRDTAVRGLASLLFRNAWRESAARPALASRLQDSLADPNPVVRLQAAEAARVLHLDNNPDDQALALHELLVAERNHVVRAKFLGGIVQLMGIAPAAVDAILDDLLGPGAEGIEDSDPSRSYYVDALAYLCMVSDTPYAAQTVKDMFQRAPERADLLVDLIHNSRDYMRSTAGEVRDRAIPLIGTAVAASLASIKTEHADGSRVPTPVPEQDDTALRGAVQILHAVAQELYFSSGAYDGKQGRDVPTPQDLEAFAELACPILRDCASLGIAQCIDYAAQTVIFLSSVDEAGALSTLSEIIPLHGSYSSDSLAAGRVVPYLRQLASTSRPLVLDDPAGMAAFRHLLAAFAAGGNEDALELAYNFSSVFR